MISLIRHFHFDRFIKLSPSKQEKYQAIQEAIEEGGFGVRNNIDAISFIYLTLYVDATFDPIMSHTVAIQQHDLGHVTHTHTKALHWNHHDCSLESIP